MTYSNGSFNPNPFANPFNTRLGPANYSLNPNGKNYIGNAFNKNRTDLPDPVMLGQKNSTSELHVPDTTPQMTFASMLNLIDDYARNKTWNDNITNQSMIQDILQSNQDMSKEDIEYWNKANEESKRLSSNMTDEQKKLLADFQRTHPSKLIDESKKLK